MKHGKRAFRKSRPHNEPDTKPNSLHWREIGALIGKRRHAEALTKINTLLTSGTLTSPDMATLLCFVAESAFDQGKFEQANSIYGQASGYTANSASWLRPVFGQVISLLKSAKIVPAQTVANQAIQNAVKRTSK